MTSEKTKNNADLARMYYEVLTDAAGYPNGMEYWQEMRPVDKYHYAMQALDFAQRIKEFDDREHGLSVDSRYGEGDCKEIMDYFESTYEADKKEFEERVAEVIETYKVSP